MRVPGKVKVYLGIHINIKLNFCKQTNYAILKAKSAKALLYRISNQKAPLQSIYLKLYIFIVQDLRGYTEYYHTHHQHELQTHQINIGKNSKLFNQLFIVTNMSITICEKYDSDSVLDKGPHDP